MRPSWVAATRTAAVAALSATALGTVLLGSASGAPTTAWGPFQLPYRAGTVCTDARGEVALASWPSAATRSPTFALRAVTAGPKGVHAASPAVDVRAMWATAARLAGPYTVRLTVATTRLVMGTVAPLSAIVMSAGGAPVPGISIAFTTAEPGAELAHDGAVTDSHGVAADTLTVRPGTTARTVRIASGPTCREYPSR